MDFKDGQYQNFVMHCRYTLLVQHQKQNVSQAIKYRKMCKNQIVPLKKCKTIADRDGLTSCKIVRHSAIHCAESIKIKI